MTGGAALSCPNCKRKFGDLDWHDGHSGSCRSCGTDFEALIFPALTRERRVAKPQAVAVAEDSTCFFHAENQAENVCDGCGRFLCIVCAVPFNSGHFCPACIAAQKKQGTARIPHRMLFDSLALALATVPLCILWLGWMATIVTAPAALCLVIYGWKKPCSLILGPRRWKQIVAGILAVAEIVTWIFIFAQLWLKK